MPPKRIESLLQLRATANFKQLPKTELGDPTAPALDSRRPQGDRRRASGAALRTRWPSEKLRIMALPVAVTKPPLVQLSIRISGQLGEKVNRPRTLVVGEDHPA